jgi:maltose alpha-D-glucosyltransferase / alpha-amylase
MEKNNLWYMDAVFYELHVKAFYDSNGDGIGDFKGLSLKLDYLVKLGVDCIWLLPFYPSPMCDDGYDISDYYNIHQEYGTLKDFEDFLAECHNRNIKVIIDLVTNHVSDQHPWFREARNIPESPKRNWFIWSDTNTKFERARMSLAIWNIPTGLGIHRQKCTTGIDFIVINQTSIMIILKL